MMVDFTRTKSGIDLSYVSSDNKIIVESVVLDHHIYVECSEYDVSRIQGIESFEGKPIKKEPCHYTTGHNLNEMFTKDIPFQYPELGAKISQLNVPDPYSIDIEVPPTEKYGYSDQYLVENPISHIAITDKNLNTIVFCLKTSRYAQYSQADIIAIQMMVSGWFNHKAEFKISIRTFENETEMLNVFLECMNNFFHLTIGWNYLQYDWQYIFNRSIKLGLNPKKASPTGKLRKQRIEISNKTSIDIQVPSHRPIVCYQTLFQESLIYNNLGSYSLENISQMILGLGKVSYDGNLGTLYETDPLRFIAYVCADTILVMMIHHATNLLRIDFFQAYYINYPYCQITQNTISEGLVYSDLRDQNIFLLESEYNHNAKRPYIGGFVKAPTKKIVGSCMGIDAKALYPNVIISMSLSPEAKVCAIVVDEFGQPVGTADMEIWLKYKASRHTLTALGRIYKNDKVYLYPRIEKKLLKQRSVFSGHQSDIYLNRKKQILAEIERRGLTIPKH